MRVMVAMVAVAMVAVAMVDPDHKNKTGANSTAADLGLPFLRLAAAVGFASLRRYVRKVNV